MARGERAAHKASNQSREYWKRRTLKGHNGYSVPIRAHADPFSIKHLTNRSERRTSRQRIQKESTI